MHYCFENVNDAFYNMVSLFASGTATVRRASRAGNVLMIPGPVVLTYNKPWQCVLLNPARDANPFFHLYEALWMLAGRNSVAPLKYYNSKIGDIASDDGITFNGAYGYRWRKRFGYDQLPLIIDELKANPDSRRCVLQMWDACSREDVDHNEMAKAIPGKDLVLPDHDLYAATHGSLDVPCNTCAYFAIRPVEGSQPVLDMTVCNRSNDLIWGMLGANAVHFAILQVFMASQIGVGVGKYHQFSNNVHVYESNWKPEEWLKHNPKYEDNWSVVLADPSNCPSLWESEQVVDYRWHTYKSLFIRDVAYPMIKAYNHYNRGLYIDAIDYMDQISSNDWLLACKNWMLPRIERKEKSVDQTGSN